MRPPHSSNIAVALLFCAGTAAAQAPVNGEWTANDPFVVPESLRETVLARFAFEDLVRTPNRTPAKGAVVESTASSQAVTNTHGQFRHEARVSSEAESVRVTAAGQSSGKLLASQLVPSSGTSGQGPMAPQQLGQANSCSSSWLPTFGPQPGVNGTVLAMTVFDDGNGDQLYAAGDFTIAGGVAVSNIAKWDGASWTPLGAGVNARVRALRVFDDGNGEQLYAGGDFTTAGGVAALHIAKWDGSSWAPLGSGVRGINPRVVRALTVFDDGNGEQLYAGGEFTTAGGATARSIAKWNGSSWTPLVSGMGGHTPHSLHALTVFDDGNGEELYAGGTFINPGGGGVSIVAKWNGSSWTPLGIGMNSSVLVLAVFDDGNGEELYTGGHFTAEGGVALNYTAKWDGSSWTPLGSGMNGSVFALTALDDGNGEQLYAGGQFTTAGGVAANGIAKWNGSTWTPLGSGIRSSVRALMVFDDGNGEQLYAGGGFTVAGGVAVDNIAKWNGSSWRPLGSGLNLNVYALTVFDDGNGEQLYAGGTFTTAGGVAVNNIGKWDGSSWTPLGAGMNLGVFALTVFDDGNGEQLYAGGRFFTADGVTASRIAKWDGSSWTPLGSGLSGTVFALTVFDDGNGEELYAAGDFSFAGGVAANNIAKWDGSTWTAPGVAMSNDIFALTVFDDGNGEQLYAGGEFGFAGGVAAQRIAKWDGSSWTPLGSGLSGLSSRVQALSVFDDGNGEQLYVGGEFSTAGGVAANRIAMWDGSSWAPLGTGMSFRVRALQVFDEGNGERLYAGGLFSTAGGVAASRIAKWDGSSWSPLGSGLSSTVRALTVFNNGSGEQLYAGGIFTSAIDSGDSFLARWGCPPPPTGDLCSGDGGDQLGCTNCPCMNNAIPGTIGGCLNSAGAATRISASGDPSASLPPGVATDLRFTLSGAPAGALCVMLSGSAVAPQNMVNMCFGMSSGVQAPDRDGIRCAVRNVKRHGGRSANALGEVMDSAGPSRVWGGEAQPNGGLWAQGGFVAGQTRYFQVTYREDPLTGCMRGLNTSQAVGVLFTP